LLSKCSFDLIIAGFFQGVIEPILDDSDVEELVGLFLEELLVASREHLAQVADLLLVIMCW